MSAPYSYDSSIRAHDLAVFNWLGGLHVDYSPDANAPWSERLNYPILRVFASPDRAFAQVADLLLREGWFKDQATIDAARAKASLIELLPFPIASIQRTDPVPDPDIASAVARRGMYLDEVTGRWTIHPWAGTYRTDYTITFWMQKKYTENFIREWVYGQLGRLGASNYETFIPVVHAKPFGTQLQSLKFNDSADQSNLEGTDPRYIRMQFTFSLRTIIPKMPGSADAILNVAADTYITGPSTGNLDEIGTLDPSAVPRVSENLFNIPISDDRIPLLWPKTGTATVRRSDRAPDASFSLQVKPAIAAVLKAAADSVQLVDFLSNLNGSGQSIWTLYLDYSLSGGSATLRAFQRPPNGTNTSAYRLTLPVFRNWGRIHRFVLFTQPVGEFDLSGADGVTEQAFFANVRLRQVYDTPHILPSVLTSGTAEFSGLDNAPYLACAVLASTTGASNQVSVDDSAAVPVNTRTEAVNVADGPGVVLLTQPKDGTLKMRWSATTTVASVWVQRYYFTYYGDTVG